MQLYIHTFYSTITRELLSTNLSQVKSFSCAYFAHIEGEKGQANV